MSLNQKLNLGIIMILIVMLIAIGTNIYSFVKIKDNVEETIDNRVMQLQTVNEIQRAISIQGMNLRAYFLEPDDAYESNVYTYGDILRTSLEQLESLALTPEMLAKNPEVEEYVNSIRANVDNAINSSITAINYYKAGNSAEALSYINTHYTPLYDEIFIASLSIRIIQEKLVAQTTEFTKSSIYNSVIIAIIAIAISFIAIFTYMYFTRRIVTKPLSLLMRSAEIVASGNLTGQDLHFKTKDELSLLAEAFNKMKRNLQSLLLNVQQDIVHLNDVASLLTKSTIEILDHSKGNSIRINEAVAITQNTATSTQEAVSSMDITSSGVQQIAESTTTLYQNAVSLSEIASNGVASIVNAQKQMQEIYSYTSIINDLTHKFSQQTASIEEFTQLITNITDQTNLLALNAAIEAARAGEHGKGFAIVADEVRKLAEESKKSAEQIVTLTYEIQNDTKNVEHAVKEGLTSVKMGMEVIDLAGTSFHKISESIYLMTSDVENISANSEEISASAEEVSGVMNEIALGAKQSTQNFNHIAQSTNEQSIIIHNINNTVNNLSDSTKQLQDVVCQFKV